MIIQFSAIIQENDCCNVDQIMKKFSEIESIELVDLCNKKSSYAIESLEVDEITNCEGESLYYNKTHIKRFIHTNQKTLNFCDIVIIDNVEFIVVKSSGELYLQALTSDLSIFKGEKISDFKELYSNLSLLKDNFQILKNV